LGLSGWVCYWASKTIFKNYLKLKSVGNSETNILSREKDVWKFIVSQFFKKK
jgi:hypothetical protein